MFLTLIIARRCVAERRPVTRSVYDERWTTKAVQMRRGTHSFLQLLRWRFRRDASARCDRLSFAHPTVSLRRGFDGPSRAMNNAHGLIQAADRSPSSAVWAAASLRESY